MFKRMFQFSANENETITGTNGSAVHSSGVEKLSAALQRESEKPGNGVVGSVKGVAPVLESFEEVYDSAGVKAPLKTY